MLLKHSVMADTASNEIGFLKAKPVWVNNKERSPNCHVGFKTIVEKQVTAKTVINLAAFTMYRIFINNVFFAYGPARGPEGYFRVERFDITSFLTGAFNIIAIEVLGSNSEGYCNVDQLSFLTCEVIVDGKPVKFTGLNDHFNCRIIKERVVNTQRYSFQRGYYEAYNFDTDYDDWRRDISDIKGTEPLTLTETKRYLERRVSYPSFEKTSMKAICANGNIVERKPKQYQRNQAYLNPESCRSKYFKFDELAFCVTDKAQEIKCIHKGDKTEITNKITFDKNSFHTFDLGCLLTGFLGFSITAHEDIMIYCMYDELLIDGDVDFLRAGCSNVLRLSFKRGDYYFLAFEPVCFKFVKIVATLGSCDISDIHMIEYKHPVVNRYIHIPKKKPKLQKIYQAAVETFRQNALDLFMDCPGRERAGWLCDSFFTARVEKCLTGTSRVETNFLENFLLPEKFDYMPDGMFPMCYPADHMDGNYIPNWAMWLVIELEEFLERTGNIQMINVFKTKIYKLIAFFEIYENMDGLLEKLDKWVFIEWSKANELTQDVNYPTNMLYSAMLKAAGKMYLDENLLQKAENIKETIRQKSFNGQFFTDNAVYVDGNLINTNEATEVCQYYAFFFDIATPQTYPFLWDVIVNDFGPHRKENNKFPHIYFANAFIGNYLRIDCLLRYGLVDKVLENIEGYFYKMAKTTGTLWEHDEIVASCDHGFASYVIYWLDNIYGSEAIK